MLSETPSRYFRTVQDSKCDLSAPTIVPTNPQTPPRGGLGGVTFQFDVEGRKLLCVGVWLCFALHGDSLRVSEEFLSAVCGRVYDFGPSDVGNLDVKMIGTFLTLWWNRFQITKYRQPDMLELALRNTNTCAQYQPHNLGPCNKYLQCGKYQLDFKPSKIFSIISSHIQSFPKSRRDYTWSQLKTRQLGSHSLRHTVTRSHTQSHSLCHRNTIQS